MSEVLELFGSTGPWTADDLPDDGRRWELVDGVPIVSPAPSFDHQRVVMALRDLLLSAVGNAGLVGETLAITKGSHSYRVPDLAVLRSSQYPQGYELTPSDFLLAIEVVSSSSVTTDRITKPAQYAGWGIPGYWRVETDPLSLTAYVLRDGQAVYSEVGSWSVGQHVDVAKPLAVRFNVDRLLD